MENKYSNPRWEELSPSQKFPYSRSRAEGTVFTKKDQIKIVRNVLFAKFGSRKSREVEVRV